MDVIYYYYFLFYKKVLKEDYPHLVARLALSASEGFATMAICHILFIRYFCYELNKYHLLSIIIIFLVLNYSYFYRTGRDINIEKNKPQFFGSHKTSIVLTIIFFMVTTAFLFWWPLYSRHLFNIHCK